MASLALTRDISDARHILSRLLSTLAAAARHLTTMSHVTDEAGLHRPHSQP